MMRMIKSNGLIIVLFLIVNICILFATNYAVGYLINNEFMPYDLSENYLELTRNQQSTTQAKEIIDINDYEALIVIAEVDDTASIGLLDLQSKYYIQSTKVTFPTYYRYFSKYDYHSGAQVGVVVNHCDFFDVEAVKGSNVTYQLDDVLNCLEAPVWADHSIHLLQNIYAIDFSKVTRVFVDSTDIKEVNLVQGKLEQYGFTSVDRDHNVSVFGAIVYSLQGGRYQQFLITAGISAFSLYILMFFVYFRKHKSYIRISKIVGGTLKSMLATTLVITSVIGLILSSLVYLILYYFKYTGTNYMSFSIFWRVQIFLLICNLILVTVNLVLHNKYTQNLTRRS